MKPVMNVDQLQTRSVCSSVTSAISTVATHIAAVHLYAVCQLIPGFVISVDQRILNQNQDQERFKEAEITELKEVLLRILLSEEETTT